MVSSTTDSSVEPHGHTALTLHVCVRTGPCHHLATTRTGWLECGRRATGVSEASSLASPLNALFTESMLLRPPICLLLHLISPSPVVLLHTVSLRTMKMCEINFLCVHRKLRDKRLAPTLIKEVTRRVNLQSACRVWGCAPNNTAAGPLLTVPPSPSLNRHLASGVHCWSQAAWPSVGGTLLPPPSERAQAA